MGYGVRGRVGACVPEAKSRDGAFASDASQEGALLRVLIGTSGWTYASWKGTFYPEDLPSKRYLEFYAREFPTTEVNYSFYHLPKPQTYANWAKQVPSAFVFAVKASRLMTHTKRLRGVEDAWRTFVQHARALGPHLGPILLQFPPNMRGDERRLADFLQQAQAVVPDGPGLRLVFEFRHETWFTDATYRLLQQHGAALCIADSPAYPRRDIRTTAFVYFRYHGRSELFASDYSEGELRAQAEKIKRFVSEGADVYVYFNNDVRGFAVANARMLKALLG
jgi:uncharacterized protein YecE (DUF72 family)